MKTIPARPKRPRSDSRAPPRKRHSRIPVAAIALSRPNEDLEAAPHSERRRDRHVLLIAPESPFRAAFARTLIVEGHHVAAIRPDQLAEAASGEFDVVVVDVDDTALVETLPLILDRHPGRPLVLRTTAAKRVLPELARRAVRFEVVARGASARHVTAAIKRAYGQ